MMDENAAEEGELVGEVIHTTDKEQHTRKRTRSPRSRYAEKHTNGNHRRHSSGYRSYRSNSGDIDRTNKTSDSENSEYEERVRSALEALAEDDDRIIEDSRRRREEILKKYGKIAPKDAPNDGLTTPEEMANVPVDTRVDVAEHTVLTVPEQHGSPEKNEAIQEASLGMERSENSDGDDMFADTPQDEPIGQHGGMPGKRPTTKGLSDNYDDAEGYYNFQVGEVLGNRYEVFATHGRGVFSSVLRARDLYNCSDSQGNKSECPQVAVKVIRANETMYKAGKLERIIVKKLSQADPEGKKHCIKMLDSFEYRNHLCLVFEPMDMNLRDLTKKYGRGIGLHINAVKVYATQMFIALLHLKNCGVLHADIKPDNILVNEGRNTIKICDFGSAMFSGDNEITPYLVSRFYRAPEVILGLPYDHPMDMWSIGCVIYELFTGQILFKGRSNNEMLKQMMDVKGPFPKKMIKKAEFAPKHFDLNDANLAFSLEEQDLVTKQPIRRNISNPTKKEGFSKLLSNHSDNKKKVVQLVDLLERIFALEPDKRITPMQALTHPFIKEQETKNPYLSQAPRSLHKVHRQT